MNRRKAFAFAEFLDIASFQSFLLSGSNSNCGMGCAGHNNLCPAGAHSYHFSIIPATNGRILL